jgi:hypothetical protein
MVLRYCRLHGRRWSFTQQCWIPFPQESFQALEAYAARLRAIDPEAYWGSGSVRTKNGGKAVIGLLTEWSQPTP